MNSLIFVLYCIPVIIGLFIQGFWVKESGKGETKAHLAYFLSLWIPGINIGVVVTSLCVIALISFFGKGGRIK